MNKLLLTSLLATSILLAFDAKVKDASIVIKVNKETTTHKAGDTFTLKAGNLVCFISGEGSLTISAKDYKKRLSQRSRSCKSLPTNSTTSIDYLSLATQGITATFGQAKETAVAGVSTRSVTTNSTDKTSIILNTNTQYLVIENKKWGPLPIIIEIRDKQGKTIAKDINEEDLNTKFIFPTSIIKDGYSVKVTNDFDELMMDSVVVLK